MKSIAKTVIPLLFFCGLILPRTSAAQMTSTPDTLDWQGYYPLEIGNIWEWTELLPDAWFGGDATYFSQKEIVADTLIDNNTYFVQVYYRQSEYETDPGNNTVSITREYLRYDDTRKRVAVLDLATNSESGYTCDLSADFNSVAACYDALDLSAGGDYTSPADPLLEIGLDAAPYKATKSYGGLTNVEIFYHGIGRLPLPALLGSTDVIEFTYVKVGDTEYGDQGIRVNVDELPEVSTLDFELYPNPVQSHLVLKTSSPGQSAQIKVIDTLGRSMEAAIHCTGSSC